MLYGPNLPEESSLDVEMAVDEPVVEEAPFTAVTNKRHKSKNKVPFFINPFLPFQNTSTSFAVVLRALPLPPLAKTAVAKPIYVKVTTIPQVPKQAPKLFAQVACSGNAHFTPRFALTFAYPE